MTQEGSKAWPKALGPGAHMGDQKLLLTSDGLSSGKPNQRIEDYRNTPNTFPQLMVSKASSSKKGVEPSPCFPMDTEGGPPTFLGVPSQGPPWAGIPLNCVSNIERE